ncbi:MAG: DUF1320 domain-containing protein [Pirellulaceae bacterium]|nr:DUF1320 domain-containing protein [Pirellulaceae bacterium]
METQIYCTTEDIQSILSYDYLLLCTDDDRDGQLSPNESSYITLAIERAANLMNAYLSRVLKLEDLLSNSWCRDCNSALAAYFISIRRGNPPPKSIEVLYHYYIDLIQDIRKGHAVVPQAIDTISQKPSIVESRSYR